MPRLDLRPFWLVNGIIVAGGIVDQELLMAFRAGIRKRDLCSCSFGYKEKAFSGAKYRRKRHKIRAFEVKSRLRKPLFRYSIMGWLLGGSMRCKPCGVKNRG
nr:MAG TPA: hypothetical protein [Caudoviricetes sp.]